jgi:hypothetical protein
MDKSKGVPVISVKTSGSKERVSISTYSILFAPGIPGQWPLREVCCVLECRGVVWLLDPAYLLFLIAAFSHISSLPPGNPLLGQLQTRVDSELLGLTTLVDGSGVPKTSPHAKPP